MRWVNIKLHRVKELSYRQCIHSKYVSLWLFAYIQGYDFNSNDYFLWEYVTGGRSLQPDDGPLQNDDFTHMWIQFILPHCTNHSRDGGVYILTILNLIKTCLWARGMVSVKILVD